VEKDGPAAKAGLQPGDVILAVNGKPIERYGELSGAVAAMRPGTDATLEVWRGGKKITVPVKVSELKEQQQQAKLGGRQGKQKERATNQASQFGLTVRQLDPQEKAQAETQGNLVVEEVTGPAAQAGVQPGDIILGVNGKRVKTVKELQDEARTSGKNVALLIQREDAQIFVPLRIP
jgi:serine protease Do